VQGSRLQQNELGSSELDRRVKKPHRLDKIQYGESMSKRPKVTKTKRDEDIKNVDFDKIGFGQSQVKSRKNKK
jgi:hypothetical protein